MKYTRRSWIAASIGAWGTLNTRGAEPAAEAGALEREVAAIRKIGRKARLSPFQHVASAHYLVIGDAAPPLLAESLARCESLRASYFGHFRRKGFPLTEPGGRLTVVVLDDDESYARFQGGNPDASYGTFSISTNRVMVHDLRNLRPPPERPPEIENETTLLHEATHQLTFNSALLSGERGYPQAIVEGLAMYGETSTAGMPRVGKFNHARLDALALLLRQGKSWLSLARLVSDDRLFEVGRTGPHYEEANSEEDAYHAYTQSWLLLHFLLTSPSLVPRFRAYLAALGDGPGGSPTIDEEEAVLRKLGVADRQLFGADPSRQARGRRYLATAWKHLGDLRHLDRAVRGHMRTLPYRSWSRS